MELKKKDLYKHIQTLLIPAHNFDNKNMSNNIRPFHVFLRIPGYLINIISFNVQYIIEESYW